ncbi:MAG: peptide ABC transporter substrate-binding protein [Akkermansia sp.]
MMRVYALLCFSFFTLIWGCNEQSSVEKATKNGILILGNNAEPQSFDPHIATSVGDMHIINTLMEGLVRGDPANDDKYHPGVAQSWQSNQQANEWIFHLRKDALWSDGAPVTSGDFAYAFHRLLHPNFGGRYADMLYPLIHAEEYNKNNRGIILCKSSIEQLIPQEKLAQISPNTWNKLNNMSLVELTQLQETPNLIPWAESLTNGEKAHIISLMIADAQAGKPDLWDKAQVGVECPDPHTLVLKLRSPMPQLPLLLLHITWFPLPQHILEDRGGILDRTGSWTRPGKAVSNGPFVMGTHRFNDYVEVIKNPSYHAATRVELNAIRFLPIVNGFTETRMFFDGKIHITNNVPPEMSDLAHQRAGNNYRQENYYTTIFYRLNTKHPPLNDVRIRQALSMAVDRDTLVREVVRGAGTPAYGFTPPGAGYQTPKQIKFNPQRARQLLAQAGYPNGKGFPRLELMTTSREVQKTMAEAIQAMWQKHLNIHIDIRSCEWTAYKFAQNTMQYDISSSSWSGDYLDPSTFLDLWTSQSGNNNTGWNTPNFDDKLNQARHTGNIPQRMTLLQQGEDIMLDQAPVIPLYWAKRCYLKRPEVKGWHPLLLDNHVPEAITLKEPSLPTNPKKEESHD